MRRLGLVPVLAGLCLGTTTHALAGEEPAEPQASPRERYNQGLEAHEAGRHTEAATAFLEARDAAWGDPELRFRAAYNLALADAALAWLAVAVGSFAGRRLEA